MDALEIQRKFESKIGSLELSKNKVFKTFEIEYYFNKALQEFILEEYKLFDLNELSKKRLAPMVKITSFASPIDFVTKPTDCWLVVREVVNSTINVKPVTWDEYNKNIKNPFRKPYDELIWRLDRGDGHQLITDGSTTITSYEITYIKYPQYLSINNKVGSELDDPTTELIIDLSVQIALREFNLEANISNAIGN